MGLRLPYTGDREIFKVHANSHRVDYPEGQITHNAIVFSRKGQNLDGPTVRREFDVWLSSIKGHLEGIRRDVVSYNQNLKAEVTRALTERINKFGRDNSLLSDLGFPKPGKVQ